MEPEAARDALRRIGDIPDVAFNIAEAALLLAAVDRPRVPLDRYREHLRALARDVAAAGVENRAGAAEEEGPGLDAGLAALRDVLYGDYGYAGDRLTYDDLQNANLMRVIDRRKGLPVTLGILCIHVARRLGWQAAGVNFPGHFLVRLTRGPAQALLDPFDRGRPCAAADLRRLAKAALGDEAELQPAHYAAISDRQVLLRLQNNIKFRSVRAGHFGRAAEVVDTMLLFAPEEASLWHEAGQLRARLGEPGAAIAALESFLERAGAGNPDCHRAAALLQELKAKLN